MITISTAAMVWFCGRKTHLPRAVMVVFYYNILYRYVLYNMRLLLLYWPFKVALLFRMTRIAIGRYISSRLKTAVTRRNKSRPLEFFFSYVYTTQSRYNKIDHSYRPMRTKSCGRFSGCIRTIGPCRVYSDHPCSGYETSAARADAC